jgi:dTMP kinase
MKTQTEVQKGKFITFEGIDGCGKTTQLAIIADWLWSSGLLPEGTHVVETREPGCLSQVRSLLKDPATALTPRAELLLMMADRAQHVETDIRPELERGNWVLCDRFYTSTMAYQGWGRTQGWQAVKQAHELACGLFYPDFEIYFDVPADEAALRIERRNKQLRREQGRNFEVKDRYESQGKPFMDRVIEGYDNASRLPFIKEYPHVTIDGCRDVSRVTEDCKDAIANFVAAMDAISAPPKVFKPTSYKVCFESYGWHL